MTPRTGAESSPPQRISNYCTEITNLPAWSEIQKRGVYIYALYKSVHGPKEPELREK